MKKSIYLFFIALIGHLTGCSTEQPYSVKYLNAPGLTKPVGFSHVVEVSGGRTLYIAGIAPRDPMTGKIVGQGDLEAQSRQVFKNLGTILTASGAKMSDIVKLTTFVTSKNYSGFRNARRFYFPDDGQLPANKLAIVQGLALPDMMIEMEAIAVLPPKDQNNLG